MEKRELEKKDKGISDEPPPGFFGIKISNLMNRILGVIWWVIFLLLAIYLILLKLLESRR